MNCRIERTARSAILASAERIIAATDRFRTVSCLASAEILAPGTLFAALRILMLTYMKWQAAGIQMP
jgi:hypothetical protein